MACHKPRLAKRHVDFSGLCTAKTCTEGNVTLHSDALSWPWEAAPAASLLFLFLGESLAGEPCARLGRWEMLLPLLGVARGPVPSRSPGPMRCPSSIAGPAGKRSSCLFPFSVICCRVWKNRPGLLDGPRCLGMDRQGSPGLSGRVGTIPIPAVARAGQSDPVGSSAGLDTPSLQFLISNAFQVEPEKALLRHGAVSSLALLSLSVSVGAAAAAVAARDSAV